MYHEFIMRLTPIRFLLTFVATGLAAAILVLSVTTGAQDVPAAATHAFDYVGYYVVDKGAPQMLYWPGKSYKVSKDYKVFAYGLDFSTLHDSRSARLPPHLALMPWSFHAIDVGGNRSEPIAALFKPLSGYDQPCYEIIAAIDDELSQAATAIEFHIGLEHRDSSAKFVFDFHP